MRLADHRLPQSQARPIPTRQPEEKVPRDVSDELRQSGVHVLDVLARLEHDRVVASADGCWTTRKVLRRLAWHERSKLDAIRALRDRDDSPLPIDTDRSIGVATTPGIDTR
jgi:hypothetical protein